MMSTLEFEKPYHRKEKVLIFFRFNVPPFTFGMLS